MNIKEFNLIKIINEIESLMRIFVEKKNLIFKIEVIECRELFGLEKYSIMSSFYYLFHNEDLEEMDSLFTTSIKSFIELFRF